MPHGPFRIADIAAHPDSSGFPPNHPPMRSFLGVPVSVSRGSTGNLYLTDKLDAAEFSEDDQRLVEMFALHAGIAIETARLHQEVQQLAVIGDVPYGDAQLAAFPANIDQINDDRSIDRVLHLGDIKSGSTLCSDASSFSSSPT